MTFSPEIRALAAEAEAALRPQFDYIDNVSYENTARVMAAFAEHRVSEAIFQPSSGYGYDDRGRDTLDRIWADVMGAEAAFVRHQIVNGTQALAIGLFGLLRPGDLMLSIAGKPYDTLEEVIGIAGTPGNGSLRDFGVDYAQIDLLPDGQFNFPAIRAAMEENAGRVKVAFIQRS